MTVKFNWNREMSCVGRSLFNNSGQFNLMRIKVGLLFACLFYA